MRRIGRGLRAATAGDRKNVSDFSSAQRGYITPEASVFVLCRFKVINIRRISKQKPAKVINNRSTQMRNRTHAAL